MQLGYPLAVVTPTVDGIVLEVLARADAEFTAPQIHGLAAGRSEDGIRRACLRLARQGIVTQRRAGNAWLYSLNRDHLAAAPIIALAQLAADLNVRIFDLIATWTIAPEYAAMFGSAARRDMTPESDIDLFLVRPDGIEPDDSTWRAQLHELAERVAAWTGNRTEIIDYEAAEVREQLAHDAPILANIRRDSITLAGPRSYLRSHVTVMTR